MNAKSRMCFFRPSSNLISDFEFGKKRLVQARVCSPVGQKWLRPTVPLIFWLHFTTGSTYHRDDNTVNALRYVQQKLSSIKYTASCFLLELEQMVYIFSVLVFLCFFFCIYASQIHYFTRFFD